MGKSHLVIPHIWSYRSSKRSTIFGALLVFASLVGVVSQSNADSRPPRGAVALPAASMKRVGGVQCGLVKSSWLAGTVYGKKWFISHVRQAANFAADSRKAAGSKKSSLLKLAETWTAKAKKDQIRCDALGASGNAGATSRPTTNLPSSTTNPSKGNDSTSSVAVKFNLKSAVGLALKASTSSGLGKSSTESNLQAVDASGQVTDAVSAGTAVVSKFLIAPNDKLYVLFSTPAKTLNAEKCLLAEVDKQTGNPACIESELSAIVWPASDTAMAPIQFGASGEVYYLATGGSASALRRYANGVTTSLINDNISLKQFLVMANGDVLLEGATVSTGATWLRRLAPAGSLSTISAPFDSKLAVALPDGNVLFHGQLSGNASLGPGKSWGYKRYLAAEGVMEPDFWIVAQAGGSPISKFNLIDVCPVMPVRNNAFCTSTGNTKRVVKTLSGNVLLLQTQTGLKGSLTRVYPTLGEYTSKVANIGVAQQVLDYLILSGSDESGRNLTTLLNVATGTEQDLIPVTNEIEVYRLNYVGATNKIMFDGLRFSDNKYVLGQIDLNTNQVTASQTGTTKLVDFQTFGS